jgi:hypothetical protein
MKQKKTEPVVAWEWFGLVVMRRLGEESVVGAVQVVVVEQLLLGEEEPSS